MSGNVSGNDTGNVSGTCNHIIPNEIKLVNNNLVRTHFAGTVASFAAIETECARNMRNDLVSKIEENTSCREGNAIRKSLPR